MNSSNLDPSYFIVLCYASSDMAYRLFPDCGSCKLTDLSSYLSLDVGEGQFHRAMYDAHTTALLWKRMYSIVAEKLGTDVVPLDAFEKLGMCC